MKNKINLDNTVIYQKFGCQYCNAYKRTDDGMWKSIGDIEVLDFLRSASEKDVPFKLDGKIPYLLARR